MITAELADQVRSEVKRLKEESDRFLQTYRELCALQAGPQWKKEDLAMVFHHARKEVIPIMEQAGMDQQSVQGLCAWAEKILMAR